MYISIKKTKKDDRFAMTEKIKISTDSTSDISLALCNELNISVLPIMLISDEKEYRDGIDITPEEFYPMLAAIEKLPTSSAVTPYMYTELFEESYKAGYTDQIHVTINSKGSGTYQNALLARDMFYQEHPEVESEFRIHIIDSMTYSMGYGLAVIEAAKMAQNNGTVSAIIDTVEDILAHSRILVIPLDLKCVKKSGRVSAAAAFVGDAIGLKPIITFENGESKILEKVRGEKAALKKLVDMFRKEYVPGKPFIMAKAANEEAASAVRTALQAELSADTIPEFPLGCIISLNIGQNAVGIVYYKK